MPFLRREVKVREIGLTVLEKDIVSDSLCPILRTSDCGIGSGWRRPFVTQAKLTRD